MSNGPELPSEQMIRDITSIATHQEFIRLIREIEAQPPEERRRYAEMIATPTEFERRGLPMPVGLRVTTRYFEDPNASTQQMIKIADEVCGIERMEGIDRRLAAAPTDPPEPEGTYCVSIGWRVCVTIGAP